MTPLHIFLDPETGDIAIDMDDAWWDWLCATHNVILADPSDPKGM